MTLRNHRIPQVFYMPIWSFDELQLIASNYPGNDIWKHRFSILGGIPRLLFEVIQEDPTSILKTACSTLNFKDITNNITIYSNIDGKSNFVHYLAHMNSLPPFTSTTVSYPSKIALKMIFERFMKDAKEELDFLIDSADENAIAAAFCDVLFKFHAFEKLKGGGTFLCRTLTDYRSMLENKSFQLQIPQSHSIVYTDRIEKSQTRGQLYKTLNRTDSEMDAWIPGTGVFQVGMKYKVKESDLVKERLKMLGSGAEFYWVLTPTLFDTFTQKAPHDLVQYAICMPLPEDDARIVEQQERGPGLLQMLRNFFSFS